MNSAKRGVVAVIVSFNMSVVKDAFVVSTVV